MIINLGPTGKSAAKSPPIFTYTGAYSYKESVDSDGTVNWEIAFTSGGNLVFQRVVPKIDVFMIGGGANGSNGSHNDSIARSIGGAGGKGGTRRNLTGNDAVSVTAGTTYALEIGGAGAATKGFGYTAAGGNGRNGGTGAYVTDNTTSGEHATGGNAGEEAFGSGSQTLHWNGYKYGAGGGGGGAKAPGTYFTRNPGRGGTSGAGDGGAENSNGGNATANSGSGGGGGGFYNWAGTGGTGGSGIIIIRNAR